MLQPPNKGEPSKYYPIKENLANISALPHIQASIL
jgi:hypothetical protein